MSISSVALLASCGRYGLAKSLAHIGNSRHHLIDLSCELRRQLRILRRMVKLPISLGLVVDSHGLVEGAGVSRRRIRRYRRPALVQSRLSDEQSVIGIRVHR